MNESEATQVEKQGHAGLRYTGFKLNCRSHPPTAVFAMGSYSTIGVFTLFSWVADEGASLNSREPRISHVTFLTPHNQHPEGNQLKKIMVGCQTSPWDKLVSSECDQKHYTGQAFCVHCVVCVGVCVCVYMHMSVFICFNVEV